MNAFKINTITLSFDSADFEAAYQSDFFQKNLGQFRLALLLAVFLYAAFGFLDPWMAPDARFELWGIRGVICSLWIGTYFFTYSSAFKTGYQVWLFLTLLVGGIGILGMIIVAGNETEWYYYDGLILVTMYAAVLRIRLVLTLALSIILILVYNVIILFGGQSVPRHILINNDFFLVSAGIITLFATYAIEYTARLVYWQTGIIEQQREEQRLRAIEMERAYTELKQTKDRLVQQEKMASLGRLTAGIAHEIKNPLNFINNFAYLSTELTDELIEIIQNNREKLLSEVDTELDELLADLKHNSDRIHEHGKRADGIIRAMLEHAEARPGHRRRVQLNQLVDEYINLAYHGMQARCESFEAEIKRDFGESVGEVNLVPQEIGRVLMNLLGNAFDAVLKKKQESDDQYVPTVSISTRRMEEGVEIRIRDNGPGIPVQLQEKIFEPFFTTKPTGTATGLGLSLAYDIVSQGHGGRLTVKSEAGEGAVFTVWLPG